MTQNLKSPFLLHRMKTWFKRFMYDCLLAELYRAVKAVTEFVHIVGDGFATLSLWIWIIYVDVRQILTTKNFTCLSINDTNRSFAIIQPTFTLNMQIDNWLLFDLVLFFFKHTIACNRIQKLGKRSAWNSLVRYDARRRDALWLPHEWLNSSECATVGIHDRYRA